MDTRVLEALLRRNICNREDVALVECTDNSAKFVCLAPITIGGCVHVVGEILTGAANINSEIMVECQHRRRHPLPPLEEFQDCTCIVFNEPRVRPYRPLLDHYKIVMVKSAMDTQKTVEMVATLRQLLEENPAMRILTITPRIQLAETLRGNFSGLGFRIYNDNSAENTPWQTADRVIVEWESLWKLVDCAPFDLIIVDEFRSLQETIVCTETNQKKLFLNYEFFKSLIVIPETRLIVLDQDLMWHSAEFLRMLLAECPATTANTTDNTNTTANANNRPRMVVQYNLHVNYLRWDFLESEDVLVCKILKSIESNEKVMIVSGSKRFLEKLHLVIENRFSDDRTKNLRSGHYAKGTGNVQDFCDLNNVWSDMDIVTFTPKVTVGASFTVENHFDKIFAFASDMTALPRTIVQMVGRCRRPRQKTVSIFVHRQMRNQKRKYAETLDEVHQEALHAAEETGSVINAYYQRQSGFNRRRFQVEQSPTPLGFLNEIATLERNRAWNNYVREMKRWVSNLGHDFEEDEQESQEVEEQVVRASNDMLVARATVGERQRAQFDEVNIDLSPAEYKSLLIRCSQSNVSARDLLVKTKYEYQRLWNHPIDAEHYYAHHLRVPMLDRVCKLYRCIDRIGSFVENDIQNAACTKRFVDMYPLEAAEAIQVHNIVTSLGFRNVLDTETELDGRGLKSDRTLGKLREATKHISSIFKDKKPFAVHPSLTVQTRHVFDYVNGILYGWSGVKLMERRRHHGYGEYGLGFAKLRGPTNKSLMDLLRTYKAFIRILQSDA